MKYIIKKQDDEFRKNKQLNFTRTTFNTKDC